MTELNAQIIEWIGKGNFWIFQVFIIVVATLVVALLARTMLDRLKVQAERTRNLWDDAFIEAARRPLRWFVWLIGLTLATQFAAEVSENNLLQFIPSTRKIGVVVLLCWFLVRLIKRAEINLIDPNFSEDPLDATTVQAIGKLLRMSVIITATLVMLQSMGYSISGVLAFGGVGGIAVGFAAKDLLANFFGGLMIYLDRPFSVGDWIRSPDKEIEGTVEDIGWRLTRIRTFDKRPLYIPNAIFAQVSVENPSRMTNRRIYETIGVRYEDAGKIPDIIAQVKTYLTDHPEIDNGQTLIVNLNKYSPSSLDFFVYTFTKTTNWVYFHEIKQGIMLGILAIVEANGAEYAFPTTTLQLPDPVQLEKMGA